MTVKETFQRLKKYTLFISLITGTLIFCAFHFLSFLNPLKPAVHAFTHFSLPVLIFLILFFSYCKINISQMKPKWWDLELVAFQVLVSLAAGLYLFYNPQSSAVVEIEGFIVCISTPTAAAAAAITGKLGGNISAVTTYTILSNFAAALSIPLIFPLFSSSLDGSFVYQFFMLLNKIFLMIVLPLFAALFVKFFLKRIHHFIITRLSEASFYLWAFNLIVVFGQAISNFVNSSESSATLWILALIGLFCTIIQFGIGKLCGQFEKQRISAGQGLGQKNMVFGLWVALTYLSPSAAIAPGCYIFWQNIVNAAQLWWRERYLAKAKESGRKIYQE
ncbi:MAG: hypothetical protein J6M93_02940 [Succinivibrio sp.]|nr:hypothetical protein [Succinivibrio sp.]